MRKFLLTAAVFAASFPTLAGGYLTNTNQSVSFLRNPARLATFELDGAYSNPAGLALSLIHISEPTRRTQ